MHIAYAHVKQECCIFGGTKCHATAGMHISLVSFVPSKALDQQAAACYTNHCSWSTKHATDTWQGLLQV